MSPRWLASVLLCAAGTASVAACGELKTADVSGDAGASSSADGSTGALPDDQAKGDDAKGDQARKDLPPGYGPGPFGALPSGYCCSDDSECRSRHCEDLGGGKMCRDICFSNSICTRPPDFAWTCDNGGTPHEEGLCKPSGAFTCIPAAKFERGTRSAGDCCSATGDGWAGLECMGGRCIAIGDGPYVCNHICVQPKDCPSGFVCEQVTETRKECIPANRPYVCK